MNRQMMFYWGLTPLSEDNWISNYTARQDQAPRVPRLLPPNLRLTTSEVRAINRALIGSTQDPAWDHHMQNYTKALDVVCASWLDSCMAQRCFLKAQRAQRREVYCSTWALAQQCLDEETPYMKPGSLGDTANWTSQWSYITDFLPGSRPEVATIRSRSISEIYHLILLYIDLIKFLCKNAKIPGLLPQRFKPRRVQESMCRRIPPIYYGDHWRVADDATPAALIDKAVKGEMLSYTHLNMTLLQEMYPDNSTKKDIQAFHEKLHELVPVGPMTIDEWEATGYHSETMTKIWTKLQEGFDSNLDVVRFNDRRRDLQVPMAGSQGQAAWSLSLTYLCGSALLLAVILAAATRFCHRHRQRINFRRVDVNSVEMEAVHEPFCHGQISLE